MPWFFQELVPKTQSVVMINKNRVLYVHLGTNKFSRTAEMVQTFHYVCFLFLYFPTSLSWESSKTLKSYMGMMLLEAGKTKAGVS